MQEILLFKLKISYFFISKYIIENVYSTLHPFDYYRYYFNFYIIKDTFSVFFTSLFLHFFINDFLHLPLLITH